MDIVVTSPLVVVADNSGRLRYHYAGTVIPEISRADAERLLADGLVAAVASPLSDVPVDEGQDDHDTDEGPVDVPDPDRPKQAAPKEDWVAYAVAQGLAEAEAEAMSKTDLIKRFA
ncbi:hypothetical protein ACFXHA_45190 [Nocardia sp. NPDC059240]|uniref:hypothetical protein n=1 Tax=Nocardia sp. NPDC059240 TaxID=3346786 RepID=UPI0036BABB17